MKRFWIVMLVPFVFFGVGCEGGNFFGCENKKEIDLRLGKPGETKVDNKLPKNDNVIALEDDESIEFTSEDGGAIITHHDDREIHEGDVIIANADEQYLTKVKTVVEREDGSTQVVLRQAKLQDVVGDQSGSLDFEATPVYSLEEMRELDLKSQRYEALKGASYRTNEQGKVTIRNMELFSIDLNSQGQISGGTNRLLGIPVKNPYEKLTITSGVGGKYRAVINEAQIEVIPTMRSHAEWSWGKISDMRTRMDARIKYRVDMTYESAGEVHMEALFDALMPKKVIPIRIPPTPTSPPVWIDIELGIPVGVSVKAETAGKTRVIYETEYEFFTTLNYDKRKGSWIEADKKVAIKDAKVETTEGSTKITAELYLKPQVTARIYRVVGPYAFVKLYGRGEIEWPSKTNKDDLFLGVRGGVGLELSEPIFLTSIVGFEVAPESWKFEKGFDLNKETQYDPFRSPIKLDSTMEDDVTVDRVGKEGFVLFKLKEPSERHFLRYQLLEPTKTGLLVPSDSFYMDGEMFFYPLPDTTRDSFKVRIFGPDGSYTDREVVVDITAGVREIVSQDRYGVTTNSYKVASGTPGQFKNQVPDYDLGGAGVDAINGGVRMEPLLKECFDVSSSSSIASLMDAWGSMPQCAENVSRVDEYLKFLAGTMGSSMFEREEMESAQMRGMREELMGMSSSDLYNMMSWQRENSDILKMIDVSVDTKTNEFSFFNFFNLGHYVASRTEGCRARYKIELIDDKLFLGFRIKTINCPGIMRTFPLRVQALAPLVLSEGKGDSVEWNKTEKKDGDETILELTVAKKNLDNRGTDGGQGFVFNLPVAPHVTQIGFSSNRAAAYLNGYGNSRRQTYPGIELQWNFKRVEKGDYASSIVLFRSLDFGTISKGGSKTQVLDQPVGRLEPDNDDNFWNN